MDGVESQTIHVIFGEKHQGVVDDVAAYLIGFLAVKVWLIPPDAGTGVTPEIGPELG